MYNGRKNRVFYSFVERLLNFSLLIVSDKQLIAHCSSCEKSVVWKMDEKDCKSQLASSNGALRQDRNCHITYETIHIR